MTRPLISIVTISFNQAKFLERCLTSVRDQAGPFEHIVVDAGSTDGSREIIGKFSGHLARTLFEPDRGPSDGLNKGFALARGDIGYFLNSDDFLLPGAMEKIHAGWEANPSADFLLGGAWMVDPVERPISIMLPKRLDKTSLALGIAPFVQQGFSFRMPLFRALGGFNVANRTSWDAELVSAFVASGARHALRPERLAAFRIHPESISGGAGGEVLAERFRADDARIRRQKFGEVAPGAGSAYRLLARLGYHLTHPRRSCTILGHRLIPGAMERAWRADALGAL